MKVELAHTGEDKVVTPLNEAQLEQLKEISTHLRQVREEKSIRIEEIAAQTMIRLGVLQALEQERFDELPEPIFLQGFIRRYGDALGLDGNTLSHMLITNNVIRQSSKNTHKNLDKKRNIHIPLLLTYILLLASASAGLLYTLNAPLTAQSITPEDNNQQSIVSNQTNK
ncbi:MAG: helix-turn-helix transcriptional regulator [Nostoc sp. ChiSLP02]|nr:helix-turn-helix transcriptional regulator [Nostoc sp. DedSLP05]MDZ8101886.1 helix-turn-helix transcriptional regulator [Nostoc sp. DedSLP01]MDZ8186172.1 helix-turn-helix transcriptional regulator [Nostoc sp. ChiSLP02]